MAASPGALRRAGNEEFRRGQYGPAAELYSRALAQLEAAGRARPGAGGRGHPCESRLKRGCPACAPRRGCHRRGAQRAAGQPRRLLPQGRCLQPLRGRLHQVSGGEAREHPAGPEGALSRFPWLGRRGGRSGHSRGALAHSGPALCPLRRSALELVPFGIKPLLRRAAAYEALERYSLAYVDYKTALQVDCSVQAAHDGVNR